MKNFLIRLGWFLTLPIVFALMIEFSVLFIPNTFNIKKSFINEHSDIELLILGSSHNQNAINPAYLSQKAANLAYGQQDIQLDAALFNIYAERLNDLQFLVLEIDYFTLDFFQNKDYFRLPWYYKYHGIEIYNINYFNKLSLYSSNPDFFNSYLLRKLNPWNSQLEINEFGFVTKGNLGVFYNNNYDSLKINLISKERLKYVHKETSSIARKKNKIIINEIVNYCKLNKIEVIIVSSPMFITYRQNKIKTKDENRIKYIDSLSSDNLHVTHLNYESDQRFTITDFKDDDHLNPNGAKKFTQLLNRDLERLYNLNKSEGVNK